MFVPSGQGGACADIYFFGGKEGGRTVGWYPALVFVWNVKYVGKSPTERNGIMAFGLATGFVGVFLWI